MCDVINGLPLRPSDYGLDDETLRFMHRMEETVRQTFRFHPHIQVSISPTFYEQLLHQ